MSQKDNQVANALMEQIFSGNKEADQNEQAIQMPELALRCAQFFHSLSQYCLYFYKNYNREADIHKTKLIKKVDKNKKSKHDSFKKNQSEERKARALRGESQPQPPKKPLTAYILYFQDKKPSFSQKFPTLSLSELTKLIAKDWKDLKQEEKKPYLDKASDDRKRYEGQMNEFKRKYRLGESRQEAELIVQQIKGSQGVQKKEEEIAKEIEEEIKGVSELGKSEKDDNVEQGGQDDQDDDDDGEQEEGNDGSDNDEQAEEDVEIQGSDDGKIEEQ